MNERVLVLGAHPDDEVLGCGATLARHVREGDGVSVVAFTDGVGSRTDNATVVSARYVMFKAACNVLGVHCVATYQFDDNRMDSNALIDVVAKIERHVEAIRPTIVYTHWRSDLNVDHRVVHDATNVACRPMPGSTVKRLLYFEVPCSTRWGQGFEPNYFVPVTDEDMRVKFDACDCYVEEMRQFPHPRSALGIEALSRVRGASVGVEAAEAFMIGRIVT